jgi:hypothetical protein
MCEFQRAWIGRCDNEAEPFCAKHSGLKCSSCGAQATTECYETMGLVCGAPLCANCEHRIAEDGTNGGILNMRHCKKAEQVYEPWYMREAD